MTNRNKTSRLPRAAWIIAALVLAGGAQAQAESISYSLMLCESLNVLEDPMNKTLAMNEAWVPQHTLMIQRTMPYFELRNTSEEGQITQISISIGDLRKNFDWGKLIDASPGVMFSLETPDAFVGGAKADTLVIKFQGFEPGDYVRFQAGISADDGVGLIHDYRTTLFQLDGDDPSANSVVNVDFDTSAGQQSLEKQMPSFSMGGMSTSTTMAFPDHYMDMIMPFSLSDSGLIEPDDGGQDPEGGPPEVPEPGSVVLLGSALVGLVAWRRKRRRRPAF